MKKFMISLAIASIAMFSYAQETVSEVVIPTNDKSVVTNSFGSNWFVGVNGGVNLYNGVFTNGESPFKHISPALNIYFVSGTLQASVGESATMVSISSHMRMLNTQHS